MFLSESKDCFHLSEDFDKLRFAMVLNALHDQDRVKNGSKAILVSVIYLICCGVPPDVAFVTAHAASFRVL